MEARSIESLELENKKLKAELAAIKNQHRLGEASTLEDTLNHFHNLFKSAPLGYLLFDQETMILDCNHFLAKGLGTTITKLIGLDMKKHLENKKLRRAALDVFAVGSGFYEGSYQSVLTGKMSHFRSFFFRLATENGQTVRGIGIFEDLSQNLRAMKAVKSAETSYRSLFENIQDAIYVQDETGTFIDVNPGAERMYGYTRSQLLGQTPEFVSAPGMNDMELVLEYFNQAMEGTPQQFEFWGKRKNGVIFPKEVSLVPGRYFGQKVVLAIAQDISERKRQENLKEATFRIAHAAQGLKNKKDFYDLIHKELTPFIDTTNLFIAILNPEKEYLTFPYMNDQRDDIDRVPLKGTLCEQVYKAGSPLLFNTPQLKRLEHEGKIKRVGTPCKSWLGVPLILEENIFGFLVIQNYEKDGAFNQEDLNLLEFVSSQLAISVRHITHKERILNLTHAIEQSPVAVLIVNQQLTIEYFNTAFQSISRQPESKIMGSPCSILRQPQKAHGEMVEILKEVAPHRPWHGEIQLKRCDGSLLNVAIMASTLLDEDGDVIKFLLLIEDVSEGHRLRQQLNQAQKMESVGTLAGGIAHDFNNLLTVVNGYAQLLIDDLHDFPIAQERVIHILKSGVRAKEMTSKLLAFSRKQLFDPRPVDLNEVLENQFSILKRLIGEDISITTRLKRGIPAIKADPSQVEQVVMNLVVNARDAIQERKSAGKKAIKIKTEDQMLDQAFVSVHPGSRTGPHIHLEVCDSGMGISQGVIAKIFDPFFTTKEQGKGTGLGLSTVYGIIKQNNGCIYFDSKEGEGTTVHVYWPISKRPVTRRVESDAVTDMNGLKGEETILLVEDDAAVRLFSKTALHNQGYNIYEAEDGERALKWMDQLEHTAHQPQLLITDMVMPGIDGEELASVLRKRIPELKVLFTSGYTSNQVLDQSHKIKRIHFLQKPFSPRELHSKVRHVLDSKEEE